MTYDQVHRQARKRLAGRPCVRCGSTVRVQAALRPDADPATLHLDAKRHCWYSTDPRSYQPLCVRHHVRADRLLRTAPARFRRATQRAPRCRECGQPMLCGQQGAHLTCVQAVAATA